MNEKASSQSVKKDSADNYMVAERRSTIRHELIEGKVIAKTDSNRWHNLIATNLIIAAGSRMHGNKCEIYAGGMRVQLKNNFVSYPDVVIVSGEPVFADDGFDLLQNPTIVAEIFSNSTNASDKTQKLENYLTMASVRECLLVKADEMRVEHYARQNAKQWVYRIYNERDDVISLESIQCKMSLAEIYAQIKLRKAELSSRAVN